MPDILPSALLDLAQTYLRRGWTTGAHARNAAGRRVDASSADAVCWCEEGSRIAAIVSSRGQSDAYHFTTEYVRRVLESRGLPTNVAVFNDAPERTVDEVIALQAEAAALARQDGR